MQSEAIVNGNRSLIQRITKFIKSPSYESTNSQFTEGMNKLAPFFEAMDQLDILRGQGTIGRKNHNWHRYLSLIGRSILSVSDFHDFFICNHQYYLDSKKDKDNWSNIAEKQLGNFYMDLVLAQLKNTFYTEYPNEPIRNFTTGQAFDVYRLALNLLDRHSEAGLHMSIARFYYRLFLFYDFIYSPNDHIGAFSTFSPDKKRYNEVAQEITKNADTPCKFREYMQEGAMSKLFTINVPQIFTTGLGETNLKKIYEAYVAAKRRESDQLSINFEPISYYLTFKLRKVARFTQTRLVDSDQTAKEDFSKKFSDYVPQYVNTLVACGSRFYESGQKPKDTDRFFLESYRADQDFAKQFMYKILHPKGKHLPDQEIALSGSANPVSEQKKFTTEIAADFKVLCGTVETVRQQKTDTNIFKFGMIFHKTPVQEIINLFHCCYLLYRAMKLPDKDGNMMFVGLYKSGALLTHCINLIAPKQRPVALFTTLFWRFTPGEK